MNDMNGAAAMASLVTMAQVAKNRRPDFSDEQIAIFKKDIMAIRNTVVQAMNAGNTTKSQMKKIIAKAHNDERQYLIDNRVKIFYGRFIKWNY